MSEPLTVHEYKKTNLNGGLVIAGLSGVGFVGSIAGSYLVDGLGLEHVGSVLSPKFPAAAVVQNYVPKHPVRLYASDNVAVVIADLKLPSEHEVAFADLVLDWSIQKGAGQLVFLESVFRQEENAGDQLQVYGVGSTKAVRDLLVEKKVAQIKDGMIAGVGGYAMSEGERLEREVLTLLIEATPLYPDLSSAATLLDQLGAIFPELEVDTGRLHQNARMLEENVEASVASAQKMLEQRLDQEPATTTKSPDMYG